MPSYTACAILTGVISYFILRTIYRLYFHPLSKFPGPKLAAVSHLYEFYYDVIKNGMYMWEVEKMHKKYGPIVRINPRELHVNDPYWYEEIYASGGRKREKDPRFVVVFAAPQSIFATVSHDHHRARRGILNSYFSKRSVTKLEPLIQEKVDKLAQRFEQAHRDGTILRLETVFAALSADIVTHYSYGTSYEYLDDENFKNSVSDAVSGLSAMIHINRFFPILFAALRKIPPWLIRKMHPSAADVIDLQVKIQQQSAESLQERKSVSKSRETIFDALSDPKLPPEERTLDRLQDEGIIILLAGTEASARALSVAAFHLLNNKSLLLKLREELKQVMPSPTSLPNWNQLEALPYLTGVVQEGLRLAYGITIRTARIAPTEALIYGDYVIPPGTPVSQANYFVHSNPTIFPNPESFDPERWIRAAEKGQNLNRFIVSFTKGSRHCLGINLAYAELYLTLATFARRFEMELYETTEDNIRIERDLGVAYPKDGIFTVKTVVTGIIKE